MKKLLLLIFLLSACSIAPLPENNAPVIEQTRQEFRVITPESKWGSMYFYEINSLTKKYKLSDIRSSSLPKEDLKVRIWIGFGGYTLLQGFILDKEGNHWAASFISGGKTGQKNLPNPKSGWEIAWKKFVDAGLYSLPDADEIKCNSVGIDTSSYVVEYNNGSEYRTYKYDNPEYPTCNETRQILEMRKIIRDEFGV